MNDVKFYLDPAEKKMGEATIYLEEALAHIRAGKANVKILDGVKVDAYGSKMALQQCGQDAGEPPAAPGRIGTETALRT